MRLTMVRAAKMAEDRINPPRFGVGLVAGLSVTEALVG